MNPNEIALEILWESDEKKQEGKFQNSRSTIYSVLMDVMREVGEIMDRMREEGSGDERQSDEDSDL